MRSIGRAMMFHCAAAAIALGCCMTAVGAQVQGADSLILRAPDGGNVRALIIGIDNYQHYRSLKGAVADARDIVGALRRVGTKTSPHSSALRPTVPPSCAKSTA